VGGVSGETMKRIMLAVFGLLLLGGIAFADIPIYCPHCKAHLYNYQKDEIKAGDVLLARDFIPADDRIAQPLDSDPFECPFDGCPLNQYESWAWERKASAPVFKVWAISLLTKDKDGNWIGVPYDLKLEDLE
jgi:hypothetical protein